MAILINRQAWCGEYDSEKGAKKPILTLEKLQR